LTENYFQRRGQELGDRVDIVSTDETTISQNPLVKALTVKKNVPNHTLPLTKPNAYKEKIFVKTNVSVDIFSNDLMDAMTLDEDNNYTTFCAVETNDGAEWTLAPVDSRLTVTPTTGIGRGAVVVKKAASFDNTEHFYNIPLLATSTANAVAYPDIDGDRTVSDTAEVHVEQYAPKHNALIPRMVSNTSGEQDGTITSGVTVTHPVQDTADELHAAYASNSSHTAFAITSADDILHIDAGKSIVLDKIEITGTNIRRTLATGTAKGGAALSFSILGSNDLTGTWTTLRNGGSVTDFSALTGTTSVGYWNTSSSNNVAITNGGGGEKCPWCGATLAFCTTCGRMACPNFNFTNDYYYDY